MSQKKSSLKTSPIVSLFICWNAIMSHYTGTKSQTCALQALLESSSSSCSISGRSQRSDLSQRSSVSFSLEDNCVYEIPSTKGLSRHDHELLWYSSDNLKRIRSGIRATERRMKHQASQDAIYLCCGSDGIDTYRGLESDDERAERSQRQAQAREELFLAQLEYSKDPTTCPLKIAAMLGKISLKSNYHAALRAKRDYEAASKVYQGIELAGAKTESTQRSRWTA